MTFYTRTLVYFSIAISIFVILSSTSLAQTDQTQPRASVAIDPYLNAIRKMPSLCVGHFEIADFGPNRMIALHTTPGGRGTTYDFLLQFSNSHSAHIYVYPDGVDLDYGATGQCNSDDKLRAKAIISVKIESGVVRG